MRTRKGLSALLPTAWLLLSAVLPAALTAQDPPTTVTSSAGALDVERLATLEFPWGVDWLPDGRLLVTEKPGRLRIWDGETLSAPVEGVPAVVYRGTEVEQGGLLDVAVDPAFAQNGFVYLSYVEAAEQQPSSIGETGDVRLGSVDPSDEIVRGGAVARARLADGRLHELEVIWRQQPKTVGRGHFGNRLVFGSDGTLFVTSGDRMRFEPAQSLTSNLGKVVRIASDGSVPADNPFADAQGDTLGEIWSYGHRNILAAAVEPETGRLWVFEMGPAGGDEVNLIEPGVNYGWPTVSDGSHYDRDPLPPHYGTDEFRAAIRTWTPVVSPSGAAFYSGGLFPGWDGSVLVGGLSSQSIVRLVLDEDRVAVEERIFMGRRIRDVVQAPDGALLVIVDDSSGDLLRLTPRSGG